VNFCTGFLKLCSGSSRQKRDEGREFWTCRSPFLCCRCSSSGHLFLSLCYPTWSVTMAMLRSSVDADGNMLTQKNNTRQEVMVLSCTRGGSGWILGKKNSLKEWLSIGTGCPQRWWGHCPWRCSRNVKMWHSGTWFSGQYWW